MFSYALICDQKALVPAAGKALKMSEKITVRGDFFVYLAKKLDALFPKATNGILNIAFLNDQEVQALNRDYRGIDKNTDVLSFHYFDDFAEIGDQEIAGEIILNENRILEQAEEYHETLEAETCKLIIHSSLHILGFDHENEEDYEEMHAIEKEIEREIFDEFEIEIH